MLRKGAGAAQCSGCACVFRDFFSKQRGSLFLLCVCMAPSLPGALPRKNPKPPCQRPRTNPVLNVTRSPSMLVSRLERLNDGLLRRRDARDASLSRPGASAFSSSPSRPSLDPSVGNEGSGWTPLHAAAFQVAALRFPASLPAQRFPSADPAQPPPPGVRPRCHDPPRSWS